MAGFLAGRSGAARIAAGVALTLTAVVVATPAEAQNRADLIRKFKAYLASEAYSSFLAEKALAYDAEMPPACKRRTLTGERRLFAVTQLPRFVDSRRVPVAGEWAERVQVQRCGRTVWHNIYLRAAKQRGLHAVNGFPGRSLTALALQLRVGRDVLNSARRANPRCKRFDVVEMRVAEKPESRTAPWSEVWTAWVCGKTVRRRIDFAPTGGKVTYRVR